VAHPDIDPACHGHEDHRGREGYRDAQGEPVAAGAKRKHDARAGKQKNRQGRLYREDNEIEVRETVRAEFSQQIADVSLAIVLHHFADSAEKLRRRQRDAAGLNRAERESIDRPHEKSRDRAGQGKRRQPFDRGRPEVVALRGD
jgi:hypothetical protein